MKTCFLCKNEKHESDFYKDSSKKDGFTPRYKLCHYIKVPKFTGSKPGFKYCSKCKIEKEFISFSINLSNMTDGLYSYCKECQKENDHTRRQNDPELSEKCRIKSLNYSFIRHGITKEKFEEMLKLQDYRCAVCKTDSPGGKGRFHVDHNHSCCPGKKSCGKCIRGLLCHSCNTGLGHLNDNILTLRAGIEHLSRYVEIE